MKLIFSRKVNVYLQLLGALYLILRKIRLNGLMAVEDDVDNLKESALFNAIAGYDKANEVVYTFACDVLRLIICGNTNAAEMQCYMEAYRKTTTLTDEQAALFECARLSLIATLNGNAPSIAIEHGRQGIPAKDKPTFRELEDFIQSVKKEPEPTAENIESRLKDFYKSIGAELRLVLNDNGE